MTGADLITAYADYETQSGTALDTLIVAVRAYAMSITRNDDVAQDACLRVLRFLPQYTPDKGSFSSWTRTIVDNCRRDLGRAAARSRLMPVADDYLLDLANAQSDCTIRTPELLRELLLHGPPQARELVSTALAARTGSLYEAGRIMGLTANQVTHQHRLLRKFVGAKSIGAAL